MKIKNIVLVTLTTLAPLGAHVLPAGTDALIRALIIDGKVNEALKDEKLPIKAVNITRLGRDAFKGLESICGADVYSNSVSVLQVELIYEKSGGIDTTVYSSSNYFVTPEEPSALALCKGN